MHPLRAKKGCPSTALCAVLSCGSMPVPGLQDNQHLADAISFCTGNRGEVQARVRQLKAELAQEALQLSQRRRAAAGSLRAAVESCLADLSMAGSRFDVRIGWEEHAKVGSLGPGHKKMYVMLSVCGCHTSMRTCRSCGHEAICILAFCWLAKHLLKIWCFGTGLTSL